MQRMLERGVYLPPCFDEFGYHFLVVVDSHHRVIYRQRLFSLDEESAQVAMLERLLDREDPIRKTA